MKACFQPEDRQEASRVTLIETVDAIFEHARFIDPLRIQSASMKKAGCAADKVHLFSNEESSAHNDAGNHEERNDAG